MAISTTFSIQKNYLKVIAEGSDDSLDEVLEYQTSIADQAYKHSMSHILCDERKLTYKISIFESYELGNSMLKYASDLEKLAIVCNEEFIKDAAFFENVTQNIGLNIMVTTNLQEAEDWITSD